MKNLQLSFIIPVYNRPDEVEELLESFVNLEANSNYEIVIVEDGSNLTCESVVSTFKSKLNIAYYFKANSGPGDSRNYGMKRAKGNYYIILDSDVVLPPKYLDAVLSFLTSNYVDCFGGPDTSNDSFTNLQKAIDFAMTSFISTGGIRGGKKHVDTFQPRSFNMGLSKVAFEATGGFGKIHPGEDPDLVFRLKKLGYNTTLIPSAYVYHKRRVSWLKFVKQVYKFGMVRAILNIWHPKSKKITYWFPTIFSLGFLMAFILILFHIYIPLFLYLTYFTVAFVLALIKSKNIIVAIKALLAISIQFFGYGFGFLKSTLTLMFKVPEKAFPNLFFK